jgi:RNA polymerase-associated protein RTF1
MAELKNRRKQKDERQQRRAARREERRARSSSVVSDEQPSSEEGEISVRDSWREPSPRRAVRDVKSEREDLDKLPTTVADLNATRLSRYTLVDMRHKDNFAEVISGAYVRVMAGGEMDEQGRPKYRIQRVTGLDEKPHQRYSIEYQGRTISDNHALVCTYGAYERLFRIADVSNGEFDEQEFGRWAATCKGDNLKVPKRSELRRKADDIAALRDRPMTEDEVNRQVAANQRAHGQHSRQKTQIAVSSLYSSLQLAVRRKDEEGAAAIVAQIRDLGGDPETGEMVDGERVNEYDARIAVINENNRQRTKIAMQRAHEMSMARRRADDARVKAKM